MRMNSIIIFIAIILLATGLQAGPISPELADKIAKSGFSEKIAVIITLEQSYSGISLNEKLAQNYKSKAERHKNGISELKSAAEISQYDLLNELYRMKSDDHAGNIKNYWIINAVSVEIAAGEIDRIGSRSDVRTVLAVPRVELIEPVDEAGVSKTAVSMTTTDNLHMIGADSAWNLGYDGEGTLVCSFDTGIEGNHPALFNGWKGHDGDSLAAWYDPIDQESFPHVFYPYQVGDGNVYHGTHSMGIIIGYDEGLDKHVGVAPGAKWISAGVINLFGASIIDAFEWAADPDGNPNTIDDVPDVINHSWGIKGIGCHEYFWEMIDNTEALGIVNIFAGGNSGDDPMSMVNPANRALDSLDCFAVGNMDNDSTIYLSSSRGPSDCDEISIKPNVVAPGHNIESAYYADGYDDKTGTSMAAPHVSGAVAILRQYAPNATVRQIKEALLAGCTGLPLIAPEPNFDYGWGLIHIPSSMEYLDSLVSPDEPDVRLYSFDYSFANPGDDISGYVTLKNFGGLIDSVNALLSGGSSDITINSDSLYFGSISALDTLSSHIHFSAHISESASFYDVLTVSFSVAGSKNYNSSFNLFIRIGENPEEGFYTHTNDTLKFSISNFGQYGFNYSSFNPLGYYGFRFGDTAVNYLYEAALMIGTDAEHVSDGAKTILEEPDNDFAVAPMGNLVVRVPGNSADQETESIFNDSQAENPIGLEITQKTYSWNDYPDNGFVIMEYDIKNMTDTTINDIFAGLYFDWDINDWEDYSDVSIENDFGYIFEPPDSILVWIDPPPIDSPYFYYEMIPGIYRGIAVANEEGMYSHSLIKTNPNSKDIDMEESEKFLALSNNSFDFDEMAWNDLFQVVSTGPFTLAPSQSDTAVFIVTGADYPADFLANVIQAKNIYNSTTDVEFVEDRNLPDNFYLAQNYPNPFNPSTTISFAVKSRAEVRLSIYNLLGEKVIDLVNKELSAGNYNINWNGENANGDQVGSGIYFYRLSVDENMAARKMLLLK